MNGNVTLSQFSVEVTNWLACNFIIGHSVSVVFLLLLFTVCCTDFKVLTLH